jgi:hypothetical protein
VIAVVSDLTSGLRPVDGLETAFPREALTDGTMGDMAVRGGHH